MFTGLVQDIGRVEGVEGGTEGARLRIATRLGPEIGLGDSIAVNGVCLTATEADASGFATEAMNQTLEVTVIGALVPGARVNLEPATRVGDHLGGPAPAPGTPTRLEGIATDAETVGEDTLIRTRFKEW